MPHRRERVERDQPDEAGEDHAAILRPDRQRGDGKEAPGDDDVAEIEGRKGRERRDGREQSDVAEQDAADHPAPVFVEMGIEIVPRLGIVGEYEACRDEIDRGDEEAAEQHRPAQGQEVAERPAVHPEGHDVTRHEEAEQRGRPADADAVAGLQRLREPAEPLGEREAENQPEQRKDEFEPAHTPPICPCPRCPDRAILFQSCQTCHSPWV